MTTEENVASSRGEVPALQLDGLGFSYAAAEVAPSPEPVICSASLTVPQGAFVLLVGDTGSGKTTLMRLCKPEIAPEGSMRGTVRVLGRDVHELDPMASARSVGYVFQSPDNQIVCDSVCHELAFGLENLGVPDRKSVV